MYWRVQYLSYITNIRYHHMNLLIHNRLSGFKAVSAAYVSNICYTTGTCTYESSTVYLCHTNSTCILTSWTTNSILVSWVNFTEVASGTRLAAGSTATEDIGQRFSYVTRITPGNLQGKARDAGLCYCPIVVYIQGFNNTIMYRAMKMNKNFSLIWRRHHLRWRVANLTYARRSWPFSYEQQTQYTR